MQVPRRECGFDVRLALEQPVHRFVELILVGILHAEAFAERAQHRLVVEPARGGKLRARVDHARHDHGHHAVALRTAPLLEQQLELERAQSAEHGRDVAMRPRAHDLEGVLQTSSDALSLEGSAERLDTLGGPVGEVGERPFANLAAFAPALSKEHRRS